MSSETISSPVCAKYIHIQRRGLGSISFQRDSMMFGTASFTNTTTHAESRIDDSVITLHRNREKTEAAVLTERPHVASTITQERKREKRGGTLSKTLMAPKAQTASQAPQPRHFSTSTRARKPDEVTVGNPNCTCTQTQEQLATISKAKRQELLDE